MDLLDVVLHYDCNLHCSYCTITDEMRGRDGVVAKRVGMEIETAARTGCSAISFTGGEPTLRADLIPLIRFAAKRGFTDIKVQTNGLAFAGERNLSRALDAGLSRVGVSVHGYDPAADVYDAMVGEPGAQALMLRAIDNLVASGVALAVDVIMMRSTLASVEAALADLFSRGVRTFNLWFVSLTDANAANVESMPPLGEVAPLVRRCVMWGEEVGAVVKSLHVPRCLLPGIEHCVAHPGAGMDVRVVTPEAVFDLTKSRLSGGVKAGVCGQCRYQLECPGLRADYVERFGTDELVAVPAE